MDENTAMNVEFLRARLLSERTVSKTAKQRAEMLSQRVYCILFFLFNRSNIILYLNFLFDIIFFMVGRFLS